MSNSPHFVQLKLKVGPTWGQGPPAKIHRVNQCSEQFYPSQLKPKVKSIYVFSNSLFHEKGLAGLKFSMVKLLGWKRPPEIEKMKMNDIDGKHYDDSQN